MLTGLWESLQAALTSQIFGGGLALMLAGAVMALARNVPARLFSLVKRQVIVSVDVLSGDPLFDWLTVWLDAQPYSRRTRLLTATGRRSGPQLERPRNSTLQARTSSGSVAGRCGCRASARR